jgi:hypothetical protein|tara:strand:+ start:117 stop:398 length:282 start_codon:yes stop_codon:yes gene_type:complete
MNSPNKITDAAYEKQNRAMRAEHKRDTGKTLGKRLTSGKNKRRVSFACRFAGMAGAMKDAKGKPTKKAIALKKWGFGSVEAARNFCQKNKSKK